MAICFTENDKEKVQTNFVHLMNQYREHLADNIFTSVELLEPPYERPSRMMWIELREPLDENATGQKRHEYFEILYQAGVVFNTYHQKIEDDIVIRIFAEALFDPDERIRKSAYNKLRWVSDGRRAPYSALIKKAICQYSFDDEEKELARLPLNDNEKRKLLGMIPHQRSHFIRARLGDKTSESELVADFESEKDFRKKKYLAGFLGYAGTEACGKALAKTLNSKMIEANASGSKESIRYAVIQALSEIHQENRLLDVELIKFERRYVPYNKPDSTRDYLEKVYAWAEETYGIDLGELEPDPVLYIYIPQP